VARHGRGGMVRRELIEGRVMVRSLHDDLVPPGRRIFVRKHAHAPWSAVAPDLRRRVGLMAGAERAAIDSVSPGVGPLLAIRRENARLAGDRILLDHRFRATAMR